MTDRNRNTNHHSPPPIQGTHLRKQAYQRNILLAWIPVLLLAAITTAMLSWVARETMAPAIESIETVTVPFPKGPGGGGSEAASTTPPAVVQIDPALTIIQERTATRGLQSLVGYIIIRDRSTPAPVSIAYAQFTPSIPTIPDTVLLPAPTEAVSSPHVTESEDFGLPGFGDPDGLGGLGGDQWGSQVTLDPFGHLRRLDYDPDAPIIPAHIAFATPRYPYHGAGVNDTVVALVRIDEKGTVRRLTITRCSWPELGFADSFRQAINESIFFPAKVNGIPRGGWFEFTFAFYWNYMGKQLVQVKSGCATITFAGAR